MSHSPADLEIQLIVANEALKTGAPYFDLIDWGLRVGYSGKGLGCVSIPEPEAVAPEPAVQATATPEVVDAVTSVNEKGQIAELIEAIANQDMAGVQSVLAAAGLMLVPIQTDGELNAASDKLESIS